MSQTINSDLIRGNINTIILKALYGGDRYGYEIIKEIEEKSHGQYILKQPTLYSCLKRLEAQGFISSYWSGEQTNGGRRKYYSLTDMGRDVFIQSQGEYEYSRTIIDQLISDQPYHFDSETKTNFSEEIREFEAEDDLDKIEWAQPVCSSAEEVQVDEIAASSNTNVTNENIEPTELDIHNSENIASLTPTSSVIDDILKGERTGSYSNNIANITPTTATDGTSGKTFLAGDDYYDIDRGFNSFYDTPYSYDDSEIEDEAALTAIYEDKTQESHITESKETSKTDFLRYNTEITSSSTQHSTPMTSNTNYRSVLSELLDDFHNGEDEKTVDELTKETIIAESTTNVREKIQVRNFGKLTEAVRELGDDVKIRTPDSNAVHAYNRQFLYYRNKLMLVQFGIMFLIMLLETFLTFVIIKSVVKINSEFDVALYVCAVILSVSLPIIAAITYLSEPFKRKRAEFNLKHSIIFRIIIMLQLMLLTYAFNIFLEMPIGGSIDYLLPMVLPMILATNVPVSGFIFNALYRSKRFAVE